MKEFDNVNKPKGYTQGKIECIDAIESAVTGLSGFEAYLTGNCIKYLWRWKHKNGLEDIKKCMVYLQWLEELVAENEMMIAENKDIGWLVGTDFGYSKDKQALIYHDGKTLKELKEERTYDPKLNEHTHDDTPPDYSHVHPITNAKDVDIQKLIRNSTFGTKAFAFKDEETVEIIERNWVNIKDLTLDRPMPTPEELIAIADVRYSLDYWKDKLDDYFSNGVTNRYLIIEVLNESMQYLNRTKMDGLLIHFFDKFPDIRIIPEYDKETVFRYVMKESNDSQIRQSQ